MITVELETEEIDRILGQLLEGLTDASPLMNDLGNYLLATTQDRMTRGEQPDGQPFAPRSQTTLDRYGQIPLGPPLRKTGTMRQQIAYNYGPDWVGIGSNAIQAAVMQFGAQKHSLGPASPWGDIPARPFIGLSDEDQSQILGIIIEWLDSLAQ
ncbi:MAG: phage virion morphogenesis protein [Pseudomonadota bacterium]